MVKRLWILVVCFWMVQLVARTEQEGPQPEASIQANALQANALQADAFVVVLMVKDEALVINQTVEAYIKAGLQSFLIFDTGSTDNTIATVQEYFQAHNVQNWRTTEDPFIDFATSRNRALDLAEGLFPDATFFLMPDAEWYLHNVEGLINFCNEHVDDDADSYLIRIVNDSIDFPTLRLIRAKTGARFVGDVHEVIVAKKYKKTPKDIFFRLGASRGGIEKSRQRWTRDLKNLLARHEKDPKDMRTLFYLAQTYECLGDLENAYKYYEIRAEQEGWVEELFETHYRMGKIIVFLAKTNPAYTWYMAQDHFFIAHKLMPHRAEPLVKLAEHYWPDGGSPENAPLCYLYAQRAYQLPYPEQDLLFVDPEVYLFNRYELLSKAAWQVGDYALGEIATRLALQRKELPYLLRNLACYMEMTQ